jgi:hypothetical protein
MNKKVIIAIIASVGLIMLFGCMQGGTKSQKSESGKESLTKTI